MHHFRESCPYRFEPPQKKIKIDNVETGQPSTSSQNALISTLTECPICSERIPRNSFVGHMRRNSHRTVTLPIEEGVQQLHNPFSILHRNLLKSNYNYFGRWSALKVIFELFSTYMIPEKDKFDLKSFNIENQIITVSSDLSKVYEDFIKVIMEKASEFQKRDSGWSLQQIMFLEVNFNKYNPLGAFHILNFLKKLNSGELLSTSVMKITRASHELLMLLCLLHLYILKKLHPVHTIHCTEF